MKGIPTTHLAAAGTLLAAAGLLAIVPLNMGGCGGSNIDVASLTRGNLNFNAGGGNNLDAGKLVEGGGKFIKASSLDKRQEKALGESVSLALTNQYGVSNDERLSEYVMFVGLAVASRTDREGPWTFGVLDTPQVNAYSGPGGYIWVTRGAIQQMHDESELAGLLGHEIGHVLKEHGLQAARVAGQEQGLLTAAQGTQYGAAFDSLSGKVVDVITKQGFTEPQEFEADAEAVKNAAAAGYDPNGLLHFLQRIRQQQKAGGANLFSTHPGLDDRIKRIGDQISAAGTGGHGAVLKERFEQNTAARSPAADARPLPDRHRSAGT